MLTGCFLKGMALAGYMLLMVACSPGQQSAVEGESEPKYGGVFNVPTTSDVEDMDMSYRGSTGSNATPIKLGYSYLMRHKTGPDVAYSDVIIEPLLAER